MWPAYQSYKSIKERNAEGYVRNFLAVAHSNKVHWMKYWTVYGFFQALESVADSFIFWLENFILLILIYRIPLYYETKLAFLLYLISPSFKVGPIWK